MGRIKADIALESCLFRFQPCSGQGQFTLIVWLSKSCAILCSWGEGFIMILQMFQMNVNCPIFGFVHSLIV